jgi:hypothetical protein
MRHTTRMPDGRMGMSSCDIDFPAGQRYIVFAVAEPEGEMVARRCGSTALLESASKPSGYSVHPWKAAMIKKGRT